MRIASVGRAFPRHHYDQDTLLQAFTTLWGARFHNPRRLEELHRHVLVGGRYLALPAEAYPGLDFTTANKAYIEVATEIGELAIREALAAADIPPARVDHLFFATVTGLATPSIDARLVNRMRLSPNIKRTPIFGLGCVAGAAGIARLADTLRGNPNDIGVLLSVELCSLTLQREDVSIPNLISSGLFGDGAAAVVITGDRVPARGPQIRGSRSVFYPDTEHVMGWDIGSHGFAVVLSSDVPRMAEEHLRQNVDDFLGEHGLRRADMARWVCHPGGPKVLEAFEKALEVPRRALQVTWDSLREFGNLSSASVLMILGDTLGDPPPPGSYGLLLALGPGFCAELVLLQW